MVWILVPILFLSSALFSCSQADVSIIKPASPELISKTEEIVKPDQTEIPNQLKNPLNNSQFSSLFSYDQVISAKKYTAHFQYTLETSGLSSPGHGIITQSNDTSIQIDMPYIENACCHILKIHLYPIGHKYSVGDTITPHDKLGNVISTDGRYIIHTQASSLDSMHHQNIDMVKIDEMKGFFVLSKENQVIILCKSLNQGWLFENGIEKDNFLIALGQDPDGHKVQQGDNKTPEGEYLIVQKLKGPFNSPTGPWLGNSWLRLNYPNKWDAQAGFKAGLISLREKRAIEQSWRNKKDTPNNTSLGGDIGIHGWNGDWDVYDDWAITWGCISLLNRDIDKLYPVIKTGTKVIILP